MGRDEVCLRKVAEESLSLKVSVFINYLLRIVDHIVYVVYMLE